MVTSAAARPFGIVTGASSGIGLGIARDLVRRGYDLVVAADEAEIHSAATELQGVDGADVRAVRVDLATRDGVRELAEATRTVGRPVDALVLNAGVGVDGPFVETDVDAHVRLIELNITSAVHLAGLLLPAMAARGEGRLMITSSVAAAMTGPLMSTYNASKTFLAAFAEALHEELDDCGVTVTALMPGGTDTEFFARADMEDSKLGQAKKDDPDEVGRDAVDAMLAGKDKVIPGSLKNKVLVAASKVLPDGAVGAGHERFVETDTDKG
ncbi:SDR family NAD(P)-dependent oxidoreductase [Iamia sp.]|uniref:SDR family NAD(P)-dependent oxidoreductase n=1 Tax=Iamia sp. TaxID=2722710 RepID=UPI002BCF533E|nr:SDR family NAD(P)-dependent oxidoreductase [Iamia sp.]HXH59412.1 SDR family NAD(P)-dependent oxidoreductase [Iamia sp.]